MKMNFSQSPLKYLGSIIPKKNAAFGSQERGNDRYAYISENQAMRMRTPGKYTYSDNRRQKRSHNKAFNEYTTISKRPEFAA